MDTKKFNRYTITAALPYANGPVHIGHLAGVYIPADIYARYLRACGRNVLFVCGSDEHGVPVTIRAQKEGISVQEVVDKYHKVIKESFLQFGISFDIYSRTSGEIHRQTSSEFFRKLYDENKFITKTTKQFYDPEKNQFLADRYILGTCPNCGNPDAYGDQCERCNSNLEPADLLNPRSALSNATPVLKETTHWYLPLNDYESWLKEWILKQHKEWKPNVYGQCKSWLDQGLQPRAVTRDLDWGVPVPAEGAEGKVLYVWFDAPIGYISATKEWAADPTPRAAWQTWQEDKKPDTWKLYWQSEDTQLVHFIGKDNIVFHCIIFPAMLKAHGGYILPENVPANEFLNLEGQKISTSRNWAVWLHEYLGDFPEKQDVLRYVLTANAPETKDNDFTWKDFQARNNNELVAIFGNFVNRVAILTEKYFEGKIPVPGEFSETDLELIRIMAEMPQKIAESVENFRFREALNHLMDLARLGNKYLTDTEPWKLVKHDEERTKTVLFLGLQIVANLAILSEPFLPEASHTLFDLLGMGIEVRWSDAGRADLLPPERKLGTISLLFEKIEDEAITMQINKLEKTKEAVVAVSEVIHKISKPEISFDDFSKLDIRIARILEAERVPKTDKLMRLTVDIGSEVRTVVSGIAEHYTSEDLKGCTICLLVNLAPREIKGIRSQGMILAAEGRNGVLSLISPASENSEAGDVVS